MNRTNREAPLQSVAVYLSENSRLVFFTVLLLSGAVFGMLVFLVSSPWVSGELALILKVRGVPEGFMGGMSGLLSSCLSPLILLGLLFLVGLSACGAPVILLVPLFYGLGLGMTEAYYYSTGAAGIGVTALLILPHSLMAGVSLILAGAESMRMSLRFSGQLLPSAPMGGMWQDFKMYCVRFLIYLGLIFGSGVLDVFLRLGFASLFSL
ncbi:MAG: hypothetical protein HFJ79_01115 [Clostridiales bacterium]|nr:hypothetical protein [Clostridiales bacterium]